MDYKVLATEFMQNMYLLNKARPQKQIHESMQGEAFVLGCLAHQEGSMLPSEISGIMNISTARIAATLNGLERKGLITRRIDVSDRRRILVDLTPEGKAFAEEQRQKMLENTARLLSMLGEHDAREYIRITGRMAELASLYQEES